MSTTSETVLVTGAGGFIGSHLVEYLARRGNHVRAAVRYTSRGTLGNLELLDPDLLEQVEILRGDVRDGDFIRRSLEGCGAVYHLAAAISIPYSYVNPREVLDTNVGSTLNVLTSARESNTIRRVVLTSTSEVFGTAQQIPMDESHPLNPQSPYAATKVGGDKLGESFFKSFGTPVSIIRPFNTFGPRQSPRAIIPTLILQALSGDEIRVGELTSTRDFTYILDTVRGFVAVGDAGEEADGETFNIGTGVEVSIEQVKDLIVEIAGGNKRVVVEERRKRPAASEVMRLICCWDKAAAKLGWKPEHTLRQGLQETYEWFGQHLSLYREENYLI